MNAQDTISILNDLIKVSEDGEKGFAEAAEIATDSKLKTLFTACSRECANSVVELQRLVTGLGGPAKNEGSIAGAAHRGWLKMKSAVENKNIAVLEEVERGQDHAKASYAKALKAALPIDVRAVIERQAAGARRNHDQVRDLRNTYKAETA